MYGYHVGEFVFDGEDYGMVVSSNGEDMVIVKTDGDTKSKMITKGMKFFTKPLPTEDMEACISYVKREHSDWDQKRRVAACLSATGQSKIKAKVNGVVSCPECGSYDVEHKKGAGKLVCHNCDNEWTDAEMNNKGVGKEIVTEVANRALGAHVFTPKLDQPKKPKKVEGADTQKSGVEVKKTIDDRVRELDRQGYTPKQIRSHLAEEGYEEDDIAGVYDLIDNVGSKYYKSGVEPIYFTHNANAKLNYEKVDRMGRIAIWTKAGISSPDEVAKLSYDSLSEELKKRLDEVEVAKADFETASKYFSAGELSAIEGRIRAARTKKEKRVIAADAFARMSQDLIQIFSNMGENAPRGGSRGERDKIQAELEAIVGGGFLYGDY